MKLYRPADLEKDTDTLLMCVVPYEPPTEEEIRRIIYDDAYPAEWKDKTPFEKTRFGEDTAKAITNLLKGER